MKRKLIRKGSIVRVYLDESFIGFGKVLNSFYEPDGDNPKRKLLYYTVRVVDELAIGHLSEQGDLTEGVYNDFEVQKYYGRIAKWKMKKLGKGKK